MKHLNHLTELPAEKEYIITIGNFDGFHRGHQKLFHTINLYKKKSDAQSLLISFKTHTKTYFNNIPGYITTEAEKCRLLEEQKLDYYLRLDFAQIYKMNFSEFLSAICSRLQIKAFIASDKLLIGHRKQGTPQAITAFFKKKNPQTFLKFIPSVKKKNKIVSSTYIRHLISTGSVASVTEFLGRPFSISGKVLKGSQQGRQIAFPTANIKI
ncbi:MAG TPA: riboflavin kinase, partial [Spirochaetota bacterium]|nr:riboflavin kinase [Spirochaetota bacterium]